MKSLPPTPSVLPQPQRVRTTVESNCDEKSKNLVSAVDWGTNQGGGTAYMERPIEPNEGQLRADVLFVFSFLRRVWVTE
jgi:hypothetical protein